jgi:hypothetical protein
MSTKASPVRIGAFVVDAIVRHLRQPRRRRRRRRHHRRVRRERLDPDGHPIGAARRGVRRAVLEGVPYRVRALVGFGTNFMVSQGASSRNHKILEALDPGGEAPAARWR